MIIMASASDTLVPAIARLVAVDEDTVPGVVFLVVGWFSRRGGLRRVAAAVMLSAQASVRRGGAGDTGRRGLGVRRRRRRAGGGAWAPSGGLTRPGRASGSSALRREDFDG